MKEFSIPMALVDYIPVIFFFIGSIILLKDLYNKMNKAAYAIFSTGVINVACAGTLKATYKLLYAGGICDFEALNSLFFPVQSIGFLLAGIGIISMLASKNNGLCALTTAPAKWSGTLLFVSLMIIGLGMMDIGLCVISKKAKRCGAIVIFVISYICCLCMGYLSSKDFDKEYMNWIAEGVNVIGQGLFMLGAIILHKADLKNMELNKS